MCGAATFVELVDSVFETLNVILGIAGWGLFLAALVVLAGLMASHPGRRLSILWGFCQALIEPVLMISIFILHMWRALVGGERLLAILFPWPIATGVTLALLYVMVRSRRRRRLSSARMWRYVFYTLAFWGFYAPNWPPKAALGCSWTLLLIAMVIYLLDEDTYGAASEQSPRPDADRREGAPPTHG
jgi:hypothetical protein